MFSCRSPIFTPFPKAVLRLASAVRYRTLCQLFLLLSFSSIEVHALEISVTGVDEELARNINTYLGSPIDDTEQEVDEFIKTIPKNANKAMQAVGYYDSSYNITKTDDTASPGIVVEVKVGNPVRISKLSISVVGDARFDGDYMPIIGKIPVDDGAIFTHADYENTKTLMIDEALDRGYFDYRFTTSEVRISRKELTAEINLIALSGVRYTFDQVTFTSDYFSDEFLQNYVPFKKGDFFESKSLAEVTQQLQQTGYFKTVKVVPKLDGTHGKTVPVAIDVERKDKNYIGIGFGFATDTLWRTKFTWSKPLANKAGHSFDTELSLSEVEQDISIAYRIPRNNNPLFNYWSVEYGLLNQTTDPESFLSTFNIQRVRQTKKDWRESFFIRWEREQSDFGVGKVTTDLLLPGVSYSKNKSTGFPWPTKGYNVNFQFMFGSKELVSDIDFYKSILNYKLLLSAGTKSTFIFQLQYGAIRSNDYDRVPVSQRFFAGGDRSIRGFDYRSVSPTNEDGDPIGGRYLEVGSLEYSYRFKERWAAATFIDAGRAFNEIDTPYSVGAGVGIRWYSPVGPFRLDFAYDISSDEPGLSYHLSLGPDL